MGSPARTDRSLALLLGCTVALGLSILHRGHFLSGDEIGVFFQTRALATEGSLAIPRLPNSYRGADGRIYSQYTVGQSLLAIPLFQIAHVVEPWLPWPVRAAIAGPPTVLLGKPYPVGFEMFAVGLYAPLATGVLAALFFWFERRLGASARAAATASLLLAGCTHAATLSAIFLQHTTETIWILATFLFWHRFRTDGKPRDLLLGSLFAATVPHIRVAAAIAVPALGGYLLFVLWERWRRRGDAVGVASLALRVALPIAVSLAAYVLVNELKWGDPLESPMLRERSTMNQAWSRSLHGFLLSPGMSVFVYSPLLLLAPLTFRRFLRAHRAEAWTILAACLSSLLFYASYERWTGLWAAPGPRYLFTSMVLIMLALGPWLDVARSFAARVSVAVLAVAGACVQLATSVTSWSSLVRVERWESWAPPYGFVFELSASPLAAALRALGDSKMYDLFVVRLAQGWPGSPPAPAAALTLALLWAIGSAWLAVRLARSLASADRYEPSDPTRAASSPASGAEAAAGEPFRAPGTHSDGW
jgi:hypothetical protein